MTLAVQAFRFHFRALAPVRFAPGQMTNLFRGALGNLLRKQACSPCCPGAALCCSRSTCAYARLFEPHQSNGPSGFADPPRPFVLRADTLQQRDLRAGSEFTLDLHVFDLSIPALRHFVLALEELAVNGIGPSRGGVQLEQVRCIPSGEVASDSSMFLVPLGAAGEISSATLSFLTPMELKHDGQLLREPRFDIIFARARDRISTICTLYQGNTPAFDFSGMAQQARRVKLLRAELTGMSWKRTSSRTGLTNELRGFLGKASYEGPLTELIPVIQAAYWTGIGRQTVWGLGAVRVE